jgi:lipid-binding SYLF domain-containing protein
MKGLRGRGFVDVGGQICDWRRMKKAWLGYVVCGALLLCVVAPACGGSQKDGKTAGAVERVEGVQDTVALFKQKDPSIEQLFSTSAGYVVIPTVGEGAFILGGAHGAGEAFEGGGYVGRVTVNEVSIGAQVGGQSYSQVVFFETPADFKRLKENSFKFAAEVAAVAADQGVAKNAKFKDGVATFVIPKKGLMASAAVGGQKLDFQGANSP